jgi:hypothetical protein
MNREERRALECTKRPPRVHLVIDQDGIAVEMAEAYYAESGCKGDNPENAGLITAYLGRCADDHEEGDECSQFVVITARVSHDGQNEDHAVDFSMDVGEALFLAQQINAAIAQA